ncbi:hypothetical protein CBR_g52429 [Chara braunii]|uniref:Uncharacterized protein n=1 Tax=Chara braunii TaxID=69332 RepID=A0A388MAE9_CHABU|nr:hypothetical protein CBR_g52429 [Chara braunii]|eukprot:GBG91473.1 hypothetical protein CBR_g52429 [Chara braunii]
MDDHPMYGLLVGFSLWGTIWRFLFPLGFWNTFTCRVETRGGTGTTPYTKEQEEESIKILAEQKARKEKREVVKQARRGSKKWEAEEDPLKRQTIEEEKKLEWTLQLTREKKKRMEEASKVAKELEVVKEQRAQMEAHPDVMGKIEVMVCNIELLVRAEEEQYQFARSQDVTLRSIRLGFGEFAREMMMHVDTEVKARMESTKRFCTGIIEGAKLAAPREEEARHRRDQVKVKFPDPYSGITSYVHLQKIVPQEQVLIAFHALRDEAASFA